MTIKLKAKSLKNGPVINNIGIAGPTGKIEDLVAVRMD